MTVYRRTMHLSIMMCIGRIFTLILVVFTSVGAVSAHADKLSDGIAAYDAGDFDRAMDLLIPLADQGNKDAGFYVGDMYRNGLGDAADLEKAVKYLRRSASQDQVRALNSLAYMFENGEYLPKSREKALCLYIQSARQGYPSAQWNLYRFYLASRNLERANYWLDRALKQGNPKALYAKSRTWRLNPLRWDKTESYGMLILSAERGFETAVRQLEDLKKNKSLKVQEDLKKARAWAAGWAATPEKPPASLSPISAECLP